ncbi:hypothetical protein IFO70_20585 [Phormidium tenue FACHB-886]|nr:hypothetical protein [Phormidium tenue FACHB-886]
MSQDNHTALSVPLQRGQFFDSHTARSHQTPFSSARDARLLGRARDQAGNSRPAATPLGTFPGSRSLRDSVSSQDVDFYSFTLSTVSNVRIQLSNQSRENALSRTVLFEDGKVLTSKRQRQTGSLKPREAIDNTYRRIRPGTYFVKLLSRSSGETQYRLSITVNDARVEPDCGCDG